MKRILILVSALILLLLLLGGAWFFWTSKNSGPSTATEMAPADTAVFLWVPHAPQSLDHFKGTPVYKMWQEQAVQTALAKLNPFQDLAASPNLAQQSKKIQDLALPLWNTFQGEAFLAITSVQVEPAPRFEGIGGFQIGKDPAAFQAWVNQVKTAFPELKWQDKTYPAQAYSATEVGSGSDKTTFCVAQWKDWVLIGAGEAAFQHLLDRVHGGKADPALVLSGQGIYKDSVAKQPQGFDVLTYVNPGPFLALAKKALEKTPEQLGSLKPYESMQGLTFTTTIEGSNFRDRWILDMPKAKRSDYGAAELPLKGVTARFTTADTLFYTAQNMDLSKNLAQMRDGGSEQKKMYDEGISKINQALSSVHLDVEKDVLPKLGPETAAMLEWGPGKPYPDFTFAMEHKDQEMLKKLADFLVQTTQAMSEGKVQINSASIGGEPTYVFMIPMSPISPAIWIGKDVFLFTLNGAGLDAMVKRSGSGILDSEAYKALAAASEIKKPVSLLYADIAQLVLNTHGALSNVMPMAGAMAGQPDLAQSLPEVDYLKPYLGHWLILSTMNDQGIEVEGIYEKGHPYIYGIAGLALSADLLKKLGTIAQTMASAKAAPAASNTEKSAGSGDVDPNMVLQDLNDLDEAINTWAKEKNIAQGTQVSWNDIVPYLGENSQIATRVGLDPLGNAYVLGKTGPGQVAIAPATQQHFGSTLPKTFWGKFSTQGELPTP